MNKQDFFTIIREGLNDFPEEELNDILKEYEGYFKTGISSGQTEEEIINNLDNPFVIVNNYRNNYLSNKDKITPININTDENTNTSDKNNTSYNSTATNNSNNTQVKSNNNTLLKIIIAALALVIFGPFLLAALGVIFGVLISLIAIPFSLLMGGSGLLFGKLGINLMGFTIPNFLNDFPICASILITLGSLFATILLIILTYYFIKLIVLWIKKLFSTKEVQ